MRKLLISLILIHTICLSAFSQMVFCSYKNDVFEQDKCIEERENWAKLNGIKAVKVYRIGVSDNGRTDTLLSKKWYFSEYGKILLYKSYRPIFSEDKYELLYKIRYTYNSSGQIIDTYETHYDIGHTNKNSCHHHKPIREKYTYQNDLPLTYRSFYPNGKVCDDYKFIYLDSNRVVETYNYHQGNYHLLDRKKYNNSRLIISHLDYRYADTNLTLYSYDSLLNLTETIRIYPEGDTAKQKTNYFYDTLSVLEKKIELNIYGRPSKISEYTMVDSTIVESCKCYNITGRRLEHQYERKYNLDDKLLFSNRSGKTEIYQYNSQNLLLKSIIKHYEGSEEIIERYMRLVV
jgi:hypothetical protein